MRVVVDRDRCEGNAFCVNIAPQVFQLDEDEYAVVITVPVPIQMETLVNQAIEAALARPYPAQSRCITTDFELAHLTKMVACRHTDHPVGRSCDADSRYRLISRNRHASGPRCS